MEVNMWPAAAAIAVLGLVACVGLISRRSGNTVDNGVADDRWFTITQWMDKDESWKKEVEDAIDNLDALHTWTEKVAGQLYRIDKFCNMDAYNKTFVEIASTTNAVQGGDGLLWSNIQPNEPGFYWFTGTYECDGESLFAKVSQFVVYENGKFGHLDLNGYISEAVVDFPVTFSGWWAKMKLPEFKEPK